MLGKKVHKIIQNICCSMLVIIGINALAVDVACAQHAYLSTCWLKEIPHKQSNCCIGWSYTLSAEEVCRRVMQDNHDKEAWETRERFESCDFWHSCGSGAPEVN